MQLVFDLQIGNKDKKYLKRTLKSMFDASNLSEEMARHFDHLKDDLREIYEN